MTFVTSDLVDYVQAALGDRANPGKAAVMQAYMKTDMPFYGVQKPERVKILREVKSRFAPGSHPEYLDAAAALWELTHREEKYLAQGVAVAFPEHIVPGSLPLYRRFIVEGAWWDFVDETATHMIRELVLGYPGEIWPVVEGWVGDEDKWLRRTAILCQVGAKTRTDSDRLFNFCVARAHESEFFIRKAIGWALRDYARTNPEAVARFVTDHRGELSPLSVREASKHIAHLVGT
jgi:3-methyladenine DNA glycosylase AlkD